ncbi:MAG: AraC family transcriptional regulator [Acidobacteriota bacterium]
MPLRYQDVYPSPPLLASQQQARPSAAQLLSLEYFEAEPGEMPEEVFAQHHLLLNLREEPHRVENWRDGEHRDFEFLPGEIVLTPAGVRSGWRWHARSKVIVITLEPEAFARFAESEVGVLLTAEQLKDLPQFHDPDLCAAGEMLRDALAGQEVGSAVLFEALARVFLVKLIRRYSRQVDDAPEFSASFTSQQHQRVLDFVARRYAEAIGVEDLAREAGLSPSHFSRVFKRHLRQSPHQFLLRYRVERGAERLLQDPHRPLAQIAHACGFADQAHFSRTFKRFLGSTPAAYRAAGGEAGASE